MGRGSSGAIQLIGPGRLFALFACQNQICPCLAVVPGMD